MQQVPLELFVVAPATVESILMTDPSGTLSSTSFLVAILLLLLLLLLLSMMVVLVQVWLTA